MFDVQNLFMCSLIAICLVSTGCGRRPETPSSTTPTASGQTTPLADSQTEVSATEQAAEFPALPDESINGTNGYLHEESAVGFLFPIDWDNLGTTQYDSMTCWHLRDPDSGSEVSLFWTLLDARIAPDTIGTIESMALNPLYGDKVSDPTPITVHGKNGFRLAIDASPLGVDNPQLSGVVYVFAVQRSGKTWKIKLRATVNGKDNLEDVETLLQNYRFDVKPGPSQ